VLTSASDAPVGVFCSYAHEDEPFLEEFKKHVVLLEREGKIEWWHDRAIRPGDDFAHEIEHRLDQAAIVLLLVSNDFLASSFCYDVELPRALARHDAGQTRVIPIIVRDAAWAGASFASLKVLPKDGKAITLWDDRDEAYSSVAVELRAEVERILRARRPPRKAKTMLKVVTVVSFALGREEDDAERLAAALEGAGGILTAVLGREGDLVRTEAGSVRAFFGVPRLQGDDALRAVRAAYDGAAAVKALASVGLRAGVATSEALVSGDDEPIVTGGVVGTAAELTWAAPDGAVLLCPETYALARRAVEVELGELKTGAAAHRLVALMEATPFEGPFVGRDDDSATLDHAFAQAIRMRRALLLTVVGPAGVGKSRLIREFRSRIDHRALCVFGRCRTEADGATFAPIVEAIYEATGLTVDDDAATARQKIELLLGSEAAAPQITDRIVQLVGLEEPESSRDETFWAIRKLFELLASQRPLVVVIDDLHRAQPTLLALIADVADLTRDAPMLLVCLARTEFLDENPGWGGGRANAWSVQLEPLVDAECRDLVEHLAGTSVPPGLLGRIVELAEGNPLFVAETVAMLVGDGVIDREGGRRAVMRDVDRISIPRSVQALVGARLERLPPAERDLVERASVEGRVFHAGAVAALAGDSASADVGALLVLLVRKDIVRPDTPRVPGESAFRFRHALIREVAYESLPKLVRSSLHERLADWLERTAGDRPGVSQEFIGIHLERAFRLSTEVGRSDDHARALAVRGGGHLVAAGRRAAARGDAPAARRLLSRSVELLRGTPEGLAAELDLAVALLQGGQVAEAETMLDHVVVAAKEAGEFHLEWYATLEKAGLEYDRRPERGTAWLRERVEAGRAVFDQLADEAGLAKAWRLLGYLDIVACRWEDAQAAYERAFSHARRAGGHRDEIAATVALIFCLVQGPEPVDTAIRRCSELVERAPGARSVEALGLAARGALLAMVERFDEARQLALESRALLEDLGQVRRAADATVLWSSVELLAGDPEAAVDCLRHALRIARRTGDQGQRASFAALLAEALHASSRDDLSARAARFVAEHADEGDVVSQVKWRQVLASVLARHGAGDEAAQHAREAVQIAGRSDDLNTHAETLAVLAEVLGGNGRADEALSAATHARDLWRRKGNRAAERRFEPLLAGLESAAAGPEAA
jgi:tetratricopeptide (TPR) repeat protein